jgi:hypothetical protein
MNNHSDQESSVKTEVVLCADIGSDHNKSKPNTDLKENTIDCTHHQELFKNCIHLQELFKICEKYSKSTKYVYKACVDFYSKNKDDRKWLVIMKKTPKTITNESREKVHDTNVAKHRANLLKVIKIINMNKPTLTKKYIMNCTMTESGYKFMFYKVGKIVKSDSYDNDPNVVCGSGIHYFKTLLPAFYYGEHYQKSKCEYSYIHWNKYGKISFSGGYKNRKKHGLWAGYFAGEMNLYSKGNFVNGVRVGRWTYRDREYLDGANHITYESGMYNNEGKETGWWFTSIIDKHKNEKEKNKSPGAMRCISSELYENGVVVPRRDELLSRNFSDFPKLSNDSK